MSFFSSVISERVNRKAGGAMLLPLLTLGMFSVLSWAWSEQAGKGDLRLYALVQFVPLMLIVTILALYPSSRNYRVSVASLLACYFIAKACEIFDRAIYAAGAIVSGHTLKHLFSAIGVSFILKMLYDRREEFVKSHQISGS
jgi:hypothetical protein